MEIKAMRSLKHENILELVGVMKHAGKIKESLYIFFFIFCFTFWFYFSSKALEQNNDGKIRSLRFFNGRFQLSG